MKRYKLKELSLSKLEYGSGAAACEYDGKTRYVRITDIDNEGNLGTDVVSPNSVDDKYLLNDGDVLFARTGATVGKTYLYRSSAGRCIYSGFLIRVVPNQEIIRPDYLYYFTKSPQYKGFIQSSMKVVAQPNINAKQYGDLEFNVPSLEEQDLIIKKLNAISSAIILRRTELIRLDELIKARFVEMFGDININDKGWTIQPLGELCTIVRGGSPRPIEQFLGGDVPWIKIGDATEGESIYLHSTKEHIIQEGVKKSRLVKSGSLIFANCGVSLGFARIIKFDGCIHDGWLAMEDIDERIDKVFLLQSLNQMTEHFRTIAPAGTQPNLNTAIMKAYKQIIPPMELQKQYIDFVAQTDKSKFPQYT